MLHHPRHGRAVAGKLPWLIRARLYRPAAASRLLRDQATHDEPDYPTLAFEAKLRHGNRECLTNDMGRFSVGKR